MDDGQVLPNLLADRARETPDRVFMQHVDGPELTFGQLDTAVLDWAAALASRGVGPGDTVIVMLDNSFESAMTWLSVSRLGAIEVQVNTAYLGRILTHVINNAGAELAIVGSRFVERFEAVADDLDTLRTLVEVGGHSGDSPFTVLAAADLLAAEHPPPNLVRPRPHDTACILYTSGTTGPSKGVIIPWAQAHATPSGCIPLDGLGVDDVWYSPFPMFHMSGKLALYGSAIFGGRFVLRSFFKTDEFWDDIRRFEVTTTMLIGSTPAFVWNLPDEGGDRNHRLRNVLMAPLPDDPAAFVKRFGFRISTVFNMTEISCPVMSGWDLGPKGSAGKLRPRYQVRIVDENDRQVAPGELGEIVVRSDEPWVLMAGYWRNPQATVEAWRNYWFHTGDAGKYDEEGNFYFVDRIKDAIRVRGENVSSMELEAVINDYADVVEAAAVGVPSEYGEEDIKVYVVPTNAGFDPIELMNFLVPRLPRFMMPRYIVATDDLPKTPTEKVRKHQLRARDPEPDMWDRVAAGFEVPR